MLVEVREGELRARARVIRGADLRGAARVIEDHLAALEHRADAQQRDDRIGAALADDLPLRHAGGAHGHAIATYLTSRYSSMPSGPPSRPKPECLMPPNGAPALETRPWFRPTIPVSRRSLTRMARARSAV